MRLKIANLHKDEFGQATLEWVLLLAGFGLPMYWVLSKLLEVLAEYYRMITFLLTLPFP